MSEQQQIFTLNQVVSSIRKTIEKRYQRTYWVKAEMHKLNRYPSGHCFAELLQKEDGRIVAQMSATIWKHNFDTINKRFMDVVKEPLNEDSTLLMNVKVSFHENYGLSLHILDIDPNYSLGELQRERQETLQRLQKEGIINRNQGLKFPLLPKRIAVISAESSKGLSDFNQVLDTNDFNYVFFRMLFPSYVQGDLAANSIIKQLKRIRKVIHHFDLVVIVRGGGGEVGMSCYNNYELCAEIAQFPIPIMTGIGHSTNLTVAEMIAYRNAITPTELADFLIQSYHEISIPLQEAKDQIQRSSKELFLREKQALTLQLQLFKSNTRESLVNHQMLLRHKSTQVGRSVQESIYHFRVALNGNQQELSHVSQGRINQEELLLQAQNEGIQFNAKGFLNDREKGLEHLERSVRLLDPINVLKRGFSITTFEGKTISNSKKIEEGDIISTRTANFTVSSTVNSIKPEKNE